LGDSLRGFFGGSGSDLFSLPQVCKEILHMTKKEPSQVTLLYIGTATYDNPRSKENQTARFREFGCQILSLDLACDSLPSYSEMEQKIKQTDIVIVSGGNTLYAVDTWKRLNLHILLQEAITRGVILTGGSAGAICWFDGGHSDSMDPASYKKPQSAIYNWEYIRVPALGFLPGLVCPHHNRVQNNGVLRSTDFDQMLMRHSGERGIGIDHFAAVVVEGEDYKIISFQEDEGVWVKEVKDEKVMAWRAPKSGKIRDLLKLATEIIPDPRVEICRAQNV